MNQRHWRFILTAAILAWAGLSPDLAPYGDGRARAGDPCAAPEANLDLTLAPGSESVAPGDFVTITLDVSNLAVAINTAKALIRFDDSKLELQGITRNGVPGWQDFVEAVSGGDIRYEVGILGSSVQSDHTIATLTFKAISEGSTSLTYWQGVSPSDVSKLNKASDSTEIQPCLGDSGTIAIACNDGLFCNGVETFDGSNCVAGTAPDCAGLSDSCHQGVCNEIIDACEAQPVADGTPCAGNGTGDCTAADACLAGVCQNNNAPDGPAGAGRCDDGNECTHDNCLAGACDNPASVPSTQCCNPGDGSTTVIDDANVCTDDACNASTGVVTHAHNTAPCNDSNACTSSDACSGGTCTGVDNFTAAECCNPASGAKSLIDDGDACTDDVCNPANGVVTHTDTCAPPGGGGGGGGGGADDDLGEDDAGDDESDDEDGEEDPVDDGSTRGTADDNGSILLALTAFQSTIQGIDPGTPVALEEGEGGGVILIVGPPEAPQLLAALEGLDVDSDLNVDFDAFGNPSLTLTGPDGTPLFRFGATGLGPALDIDIRFDPDGNPTVELGNAGGDALRLEFGGLPPGSFARVARDGPGDQTITVTDTFGEALDVTIIAVDVGDNAVFSIVFNAAASPASSRLIHGVPGFKNDTALGSEVVIDASGLLGGGKVTLLLGYDPDDVENGAFDESELRIRRWNDLLSAYEPAGVHDAGVGGATGVAGDFGINVEADSAWAELTQFGTFAVGPVPQEDDEPAQPLPIPRACGSDGGMCGAFNMMVLPLTLMSLMAMRRRATGGYSCKTSRP